MSSHLDHETGAIRKKWKGRLPVALLYPNTYAVAVSNLGWQLVYSLLNAMDAVVCERFVYPETGQPLRSLESSRPLTDFPLVLGSISFEHDYPRLAALLAAGGIPPLAASRSAAIRPGDPPCRSLLAGLEGALRGVRWHAIPAAERARLWADYEKRRDGP